MTLPTKFYINLFIVFIVPCHALSFGGNRYLKDAALRMSNFFMPGGDDKNLVRNADLEAQGQKQWSRGVL